MELELKIRSMLNYNNIVTANHSIKVTKWIPNLFFHLKLVVTYCKIFSAELVHCNLMEYLKQPEMDLLYR
uniref:Uncharacterized protein n=1 Tax=Candidatus Nitrotoga fabula TaxID=2182327 RepID=A0A2X0R6D5_9PROT|nr:protein of unknown function [Candidatus Nitrotoga fabula]